jgi:hypothetical protein
MKNITQKIYKLKEYPLSSWSIKPIPVQSSAKIKLKSNLF